MLVVNLHDDPPLTDIPARLRLLADKLEHGDYPAQAVYVLLADGERVPRLFGFGNVEGRNDAIIQLARASHWLVAGAGGG